MTDRIELLAAINRVRRQFPRQLDVLLVCEAAEQSAVGSQPKVGGFDRTAYMREYMRVRRAGGVVSSSS